MNDVEAKLERDQRYKSFALNVSKCLKASEQAREWADLISFLGRLNKVCNLTMVDMWREAIFVFVARHFRARERVCACVYVCHSMRQTSRIEGKRKQIDIFIEAEKDLV